MNDIPRIDALLKAATDALVEVSESPRLDAELLLARALDVPRSYLFAHPEDVPDGSALERFNAAVSRRGDGEPLAYLTGEKEFWSLALIVTPDTLVPRPETEVLVAKALTRLPASTPAQVLDLGTGSGAIAIAIAHERRDVEIVATDTSAAALTVARENASFHNLANIEFVQGDWLEPVAARQFDIIVSNPPYVDADDPCLEALRHEPLLALSPGADGSASIRRIARDARHNIRSGGSLVLEHGDDQQSVVADILQEFGWLDIECVSDLGGRPRVTVAVSP